MSSTGSLYGIDVSKWQGTIDWARVRAAGKRFAFGKATEGVSVVDSTYARNKSGAMANGIAFGAYHFAQPANDPTREADWFVNNAGYKHGMLVPVLDLERTGGRSTAGLQSWVKTFLARVKYRLGVKPMIYTSPGFWRSYMGDTRWFADNGYSMLWVAHWGVSSPSRPGQQLGRPILDVLAVQRDRQGAGDLQLRRPESLPLLVAGAGHLLTRRCRPGPT